MNKLVKAKNALFEIWSPSQVIAEYKTDEILDRTIRNWELQIEDFDLEDFDRAIHEIKDDVVTERRGRFLDRALLSTLLQYCAVARRQRILSRSEPETPKPIPTPEDIERDRKAREELMAWARSTKTV